VKDQLQWAVGTWTEVQNIDTVVGEKVSSSQYLSFSLRLGICDLVCTIVDCI
jgi:hypothetical protein